ncbi:MAG: DUF427 domain-containing protein [Rhodospirillales bacterium]|nr:MAG: DUF427 domain-containing protein [Rhodospirillales bacterium]
MTIPSPESVWDYSRPPRLEPVTLRLRVVFAGETVADTSKGFRVLETSHPPTYYLPPGDVRMDRLRPNPRRSFCEFKGAAAYWDVVVGERSAPAAAWCYPDPTPAFAAIRDYISFYAAPMDACYVGDEQVQPQAGDFYGGWVTSWIQGPFKGGPGTYGW